MAEARDWLKMEKDRADGGGMVWSLLRIEAPGVGMTSVRKRFSLPRRRDPRLAPKQGARTWGTGFQRTLAQRTRKAETSQGRSETLTIAGVRESRAGWLRGRRLGG